MIHRSHFRKPLLGTVLAVAAFAVALTPATSSWSAVSATAPTLFVSAAGSDAGDCSRSSPCKSFDRAYQLAAPGALVEVAAGRHPAQTINPRRTGRSGGANVVFRPAAGAKVTLTGTLNANGSRFELRNMTVDQANFPRSADRIVFRNVVNHGMWMQGPSNISIVGGEISCGFCPYHSHLQNGGSDAAPPRNILFDGVNFHDWHSVNGEHTECLQILGGDRITIRNSVFRNCATGAGGRGATGALFIGWLGGNGPVTKNVLIENNFFYPSGNHFAIQMSDLANLDLRYNSIASPVIVFDREGPGTGMDFVGNILRAGSCTAENNRVPINWRYNVIEGGRCGRTDKNARSGFVDASRNLHLRAGAPAINAGDPRSHPTRDIDRQRRPAAGRPDAGADERR